MEKKYHTIEEINAEHEEWKRIILQARKQFPHTNDVIYLLTVWYYSSVRPRYPRFKVKDGEHIYFHSVADAEARIPKIIKERDRARKERFGMPADRTRPYCFLVEEIPIGCSRGWRNESQAWWRYDGNGKLVISSLVSEWDYEGGYLEPFFGRFPDTCPVKEGDIVEVMDGNDVSLEIVYSLPLEPIKAMHIEQRRREDLISKFPEMDEDSLFHLPHCDYTDDCYITLDGTMIDGKNTYMCAHSHPRVKWVFPARHNVPNNVSFTIFCTINSPASLPAAS